MSQAVRRLQALGLGLAVSLALFWLMQQLVVSPGQGWQRAEPTPALEFLRVERETRLDTRERRRPERPEPPRQPPRPELRVATPPAPAPEAPVPFELPRLNLPTTLAGGPNLGEFRAATLAGDAELVPLVRVPPQYPRQAARDNIEGRVTVEVVVGTDGRVRSARVLRAEPRGYFEQAALQSARASSFRPRTVDGEPVETTGTYDIVFSLEGAP